MNSSRSFSRRNFVKLVALGGAAPFILPSHIWAAEVMPNSRINVGFIGMGKQSEGLLRTCLALKELKVVAVSDPDTTRRENAQQNVDKESGGKDCAGYSDFRELLARKDIDAVVIATPDHWHALNAIAAARAGKDIYCEKPMAHTIDEGRAMVNAVRENKRILQVGSMQRSMPGFRDACELVRNGIIGKITGVDAMVGGPSIPCNLPGETPEPGLDWDMWLGPAPMRPYHSKLCPRGLPKSFPGWRDYDEYGGGKVYDWGAHHFDIIQWALGYDESGPVEFLPAPKAGAESGARYRYDNGIEVTHKPGNGVWFYGDKGKIYVNRGKLSFWLGEKLIAENLDSYAGILNQYLPADAVRLYKSTNHIGDWVSSIKSRKPPICDVEIGHRTSTICGLVNLTYHHQQKLLWNPKTEQFTGGTGNPKWKGREYRDAWKLA